MELTPEGQITVDKRQVEYYAWLDQKLAELGATADTADRGMYPPWTDEKGGTWTAFSIKKTDILVHRHDAYGSGIGCGYEIFAQLGHSINVYNLEDLYRKIAENDVRLYNLKTCTSSICIYQTECGCDWVDHIPWCTWISKK